MSDTRPQRGPEPRRRRRRSRHTLRLPRLRWIALIVLGFLLAGVGGVVSFFWPTITAAVGATGQNAIPSLHPTATSGPATSPPSTAPPTGSAFTVLLMGSDNDQKFTNGAGTPIFCCAQSLILMRVDPSTSSVTMLSIPRDFWVPLYSGTGASLGSGKVDQAFGDVSPPDGTNGASAEIATIERDFQVSVDHYVWIGLEGLINLINEVGGIDIVASHPVMDDNYPYDVAGSTNPNAADRVSVLPGAQHMDGYEALEYVRSRHDDLNGDLGRTVRQQQVLVALRQKLAQLSIADVNGIASALSGQVLTDVPLTNLPTLLGLVKDVESGSIQHVFLTQFSMGVVDSQDVELPDMSAILGVVHQYFPAP
ncbi:MAG TPA: LCP family protein [Candidatus Binatia bacterium]|nr:LCP family protein [Candidatus Binatia bacterium]